MATLQDRAVTEIIMSEQSVLAFESGMERRFRSMEAAILSIILSFISRHGEAGVVPFAVLRRAITAQEMNSFKASISEWITQMDENLNTKAWNRFKKSLELLLKRKRITYMEMLQAQMEYEVRTTYEKERLAFTPLAGLNILAAFLLRAYDTAQVKRTGIIYRDITDAEIQTIYTSYWKDISVDGNYLTRSAAAEQRAVDAFDTILPQSIAAARTAKGVEDVVAKKAKSLIDHEKALLRSETNELVNEADLLLYKIMELQKYRYVAILDEVTTDICRNLNGQVFLVSQATVNVNYPPLHANCRSTTEAVLEDYRPKLEELLTVSRSETIEEFIEKHAPEHRREELLEFFRKYYG